MSSFKFQVFLLGPAGSFSDLARRKMRLLYIPHYVSSFQEIFSAVKKGAHGLVPFRNKIIGDLPEVARFFSEKNSRIVRYFRMPVRFVLVAKSKIPVKGVRRLYTSRVVHVQCRKFITKNLASAHGIFTMDSSSSSYKKIVQLKRGDAATIGSAWGAKQYGLKILAQNIQDDPNDWTEFVLFR